jgi:hypothetical protein
MEKRGVLVTRITSEMEGGEYMLYNSSAHGTFYSIQLESVQPSDISFLA